MLPRSRSSLVGAFIVFVLYLFFWQNALGFSYGRSDDGSERGNTGTDGSGSAAKAGEGNAVYFEPENGKPTVYFVDYHLTSTVSSNIGIATGEVDPESLQKEFEAEYEELGL